MSVAPQNFNFRSHRMSKFTGGLTFTQAQPSDCVQFMNVDMQRDQYVRARRGIYRLNSSTNWDAGEMWGLGVAFSSHTNDTSIPVTPYILAAKTGNKIYYINARYAKPAVGGTSNFSFFTIPTPLALNNSDFTKNTNVQFETAYKLDGSTVVIMAHPSWEHLLMWQRNDNLPSAAATSITDSPSGNLLALHTDNRLYVVSTSDHNMLIFSDPGDPTSWPTANKLAVTTKYGEIKALQSAADRLLMFCENGIISMQGDPTSQPYVAILHPQVGCTDHGNVSMYGNSSVFNHFGGVYDFSGGVNLVSDSVRGMISAPTNGLLTNVGGWGALSPYHYISRGNETTSGQPNKPPSLMVYERLRYGHWSMWTYPTTTAIGTTPTIRPLVLWVDHSINAFILNGGDGNLYVQEMWMSGNSGVGPPVPPSPTTNPGDSFSKNSMVDSTAIPVYVSLISRMEGQQDDLLVKTWRRLQILGEGTNVTVKLNLYDSTNTVKTITIATNASLPADFSAPSVDGGDTSPPTEYVQFQLEISGNQLVVKDILLDWRPSRYGLLNYD